MRKLKFSAVMMVMALCAASIAATQYIKPDSVDYKSILTTVPSEDSAQTKQEIQTLLDWQQKRTAEEVKRCKSEEDLSVFAFSNVLGSWFNPDDLPETAKLLKEVQKQAKPIYSGAKDFFDRKRPYKIDSRIKPCLAMEDTASYPSGHSTRTIMWGTILGEMFPDKKDTLMERARQIGDDRVIAGMHFPSDVEAGRVLGAAIAQQFLKNPDFKAALEKAREECLAGAAKH